MDNKHNNLNLAAKICSDICPWTLSVPRSSQFSSSFALGKLFSSRNSHRRGDSRGQGVGLPGNFLFQGDKVGEPITPLENPTKDQVNDARP